MSALETEMAKSMGGVENVSVFGLFSVPESVVVSWILVAGVAVVSYAATRHLKKDNPSRGQLLLETGVERFNNFCKDLLGRHWRDFAPWLLAVTLFISCANLAGVVGLNPPTRDLSVTASLALMSMLLIYGAQFKYRGFSGGLKKFAEPMFVLAPINMMEVFIRPLSLCMRLFGNILASYVVMKMIEAVAPVVVPVPFSLYFDIFDGLIQTLVFVFLTTIFVGDSIEGC